MFLRADIRAPNVLVAEREGRVEGGGGGNEGSPSVTLVDYDDFDCARASAGEILSASAGYAGEHEVKSPSAGTLLASVPGVGSRHSAASSQCGAEAVLEKAHSASVVPVPVPVPAPAFTLPPDPLRAPSSPPPSLRPPNSRQARTSPGTRSPAWAHPSFAALAALVKALP